MNCTGFALVNYRAGTYNYISNANFPIHASCTLRLSSALTFAESSRSWKFVTFLTHYQGTNKLCRGKEIYSQSSVLWRTCRSHLELVNKNPQISNGTSHSKYSDCSLPFSCTVIFGEFPLTLLGNSWTFQNITKLKSVAFLHAHFFSLLCFGKFTKSGKICSCILG